MKIFKSLTTKKTALVFILLFIGALALLHQFVILYGDDYYHSTAANGTWQEFWDFHIQHYLKANGRALIHFAITLCFFGEGVAFWKILSPILLGLTVLFAVKAFSDNKNFTTVLASICVVLLGLGGKFTSYSVYTLTPVFNYVYPFLFMFPLIFYSKQTYQQERRFLFLPILGFLAGASMEQTGIMAIGYIVMMIFERIVTDRKAPKPVLIFTLISTIIGYITVMLAPGNFVRMETSTNPFFENFIAASTMLINQKPFVLFNAFLVCSLCYWLVRIKKTNSIIRYFNLLLALLLTVGYFFNLLLIFGIGGLSFETPGIIGIVWKLFDLCYIFSMLYVPIYVFLKEKRWDILTHMIMAIGSIVILFFASVSEWRPLTPAIIVFTIFIALTVADVKTHLSLGFKPLVSIATILSLAIFAGNLTGMIQNYNINKENEKRIEIYLNNEDFDKPLALLPAEDEETLGYGINLSGHIYTYPLKNPSSLIENYSLRFKEFYNIPIETTIIIESNS